MAYKSNPGFSSGKISISKNLFFLFIFLIVSSSFLIPNSYAQWVRVANGMPAPASTLSLAVNGSAVFVGLGAYYGHYGVYKTTNNGDNWSYANLGNQSVGSIIVGSNVMFAGSSGGVNYSTDNGSNWNQASLNYLGIYSMTLNATNAFAGTGSGIFMAALNNPSSWSPTTVNQSVLSLAANGNTVFAGTDGNGVFISTNNGTTWNQTSMNSQQVWSIAVSGNNVFAGTGIGIYISSNSGASWTYNSSFTLWTKAFAINGNTIFAGTGASGFYVSNDNGLNWTPKNEGLSYNNITNICTIGNYIFISTLDENVYRRQLSELTGIQPISQQVPSHFSLSQNYPNPFNPTTKFKIEIAKSSYTKLTVFDVLGREVATLVNQQLQPGTYEVNWDASNYPSGVYYYKISAEGYSDTKKMILLK
jgi:hypothetical protein